MSHEETQEGDLQGARPYNHTHQKMTSKELKQKKKLKQVQDYFQTDKLGFGGVKGNGVAVPTFDKILSSGKSSQSLSCLPIPPIEIHLRSQ